MTQAEFTKKIYNIIKDKAFISNFHLSAIAEVVEELPTEIVPGKVLFDGMMQLDGFEGIEDDIQQMHAYTKDGVTVNLEDYYTDNGAFDDDGWDRFIKALGNLMTVEEYNNFVEVADIEWPNGTIAHYLITRDGVMHISGDLWDGDIKFETTYPFHELVIEEGITEIGNFNFSEWDQLEEVTIPPSVEEIGRAAFLKCQNIPLKIPGCVPSRFEWNEQAPCPPVLHRLSTHPQQFRHFNALQDFVRGFPSALPSFRRFPGQSIQNRPFPACVKSQIRIQNRFYCPICCFRHGSFLPFPVSI